MELVLLNNTAELPRLHDALDAFGRDHQWPAQSLAGVHVALEEHLTNVISYGYAAGQPGRIVIRFAEREHSLEIEVEDDGNPFNPLEQPAPDFAIPLDQRPLGGLGVHFLRQLTDAQEYRRQGGRNILKLTKRSA